MLEQEAANSSCQPGWDSQSNLLRSVLWQVTSSVWHHCSLFLLILSFPFFLCSSHLSQKKQEGS